MKRIFTLLAFLFILLTVNAQIPIDGLVAWYPFNGNANDESGNGFDGTVYGATLTADRYGNPSSAFYFDGVNDNIITNTMCVLGGNKRTVSFWAKTESLNTTHGMVAVTWGGPNTNGNRFDCYFNYQVPGVSAGCAWAAITYQPISYVSDNNWHHYIFMIDTITPKLNHIKVFQDAQQLDVKLYILNENTSINTLPGSTMRFGSGDNAAYFHGSLDDIRVWSTDLSQSEIISLFNEGPCAGTVGAKISGTATYDNAPVNTLLSCVKVYLKTTSDILVDSTETDLLGNYEFCGVPNGSYKLTAQTTKTWGGVNNIDALLVLKHFVGYITLDGLKEKAGDINLNDYLNSTDALMIAKRFVGVTTSYPGGDWILEEPTLNVSGSSALTIDFKGICTGDANGSYIPPSCGFVNCGDTLTDFRDWQKYPTVQIGTQCWMKENLNIGVMRNSNFGLPVHSNCNNDTIIEKYCYNNEEGYCNIYGGLYDWNEMMNYSSTPGSQGICPIGWHIPSDADWCLLATFLDNSVSCTMYGGGSNGTTSGGKLKATGTEFWTAPNTGATNSSNFTALGAGERNGNGNFMNKDIFANFWTSNESVNQAFYWYVINSSQNIYRNAVYKVTGHSVRCIKD
jgi:uncharacterized protein (TIGR02145 family)